MHDEPTGQCRGKIELCLATCREIATPDIQPAVAAVDTPPAAAQSDGQWLLRSG